MQKVPPLNNFRSLLSFPFAPGVAAGRALPFGALRADGAAAQEDFSFLGQFDAFLVGLSVVDFEAGGLAAEGAGLGHGRAVLFGCHGGLVSFGAGWEPGACHIVGQVWDRVNGCTCHLLCNCAFSGPGVWGRRYVWRGGSIAVSWGMA